MAIQAVAGTVQHSGVFIPELWSTKLLVKFYASCVLASISNTDYSGEIKNVGDVVKIRQTPDITIRSYTKNSNLVHQRPESSVVEFPISYAKYFDFIADDIDVYQSDIKIMTNWAEDAAQQMKITIEDGSDSDGVFANVYADAHASNKGASAGAKSGDINMGSSGAPLAVTKTDILDQIVDVNTVLSEQNVPETQRWMVVPVWFCGMILKSDLKDASLAGDGTSILRNGRIGLIDRTEIFESNLLYSTTDGSYTVWHAIGGQRHALSFAAQMTKVEHLDKVESTFGSIVRGLNVYGYKILKSQALVDFYIRKGTA
uniref:Putative coat protein n=1 Tax=viral metagenome TaxID=1070528 RepID=A0A6M3XRR8_9ZZZZ